MTNSRSRPPTRRARRHRRGAGATGSISPSWMSACPTWTGAKPSRPCAATAFAARSSCSPRKAVGHRHGAGARGRRQRLCGKPFKFAVLLARIRAQLRQYEASEDAVFQIGPYTFRPGAEAAASREGLEAQADREGDGDPALSLPGGPARGRPRRAACRRSGATMPTSRPTPSKPTSTACGRRSRPIRPTPASS